MTETKLALAIDIEFDESPPGTGGKPASAARVVVECRDGHTPSAFECFEIVRLISECRFQAFRGKKKTPPVTRRVEVNAADVDPTAEIHDAEYLVRVERDDGAQLVQGEFDALILTYMINMKSEFASAEPELQPTVITSPAIYPMLSKMPKECLAVWHQAMSQLMPDDEQHVVQVSDLEPAQLLIQAGLFAATTDPTKFEVNKNFAYCTYAQPGSNNFGTPASSVF